MESEAEEYHWQIRHGYSSWRIPLTNQAWIQQLKNTPTKSGMDTAADEYHWQIWHGYSRWTIPLPNQAWKQQMCQRYFSQLLYPCFMCQGYSSAAVSMPDLWELFFSCCIHVLFFRGIPQLLHPCLIW
jgi:hypothetical protein